MSEFGRGLVERDLSTHPVGYLGEMCAPFPIAPMSDSEIDDRLDAMVTSKATLIDLREMSGPNGGRIPSTNQGSSNYCWAHSTVSCMLLLRAKSGLPYIPLNAFSVACPIMQFQNNGGWCQQSLKRVSEQGCSTTKTWKYQSFSQANVTPEQKTEALEYRVTEWWDGGDDPKLFWTALALGLPMATDWSSWGHSVCTIGGNRKRGEVMIWNSWGESWKTNGVGRPDARERTPQNWVCPRVVTA